MRLFLHLIYEYRKGLRKLVLYTTNRSYEDRIRAKLVQQCIPHLIHDIGRGKINVFFGEACCVEVVRLIGKRNVARYTDEEDFILGAMLGYDLNQQCRRYLKRKRRPLAEESPRSGRSTAAE